MRRHTGEKRLVKSRSGQYTAILQPVWSPTGSHLNYHKTGSLVGGGRSDVYRVSATGNGKTNLTTEEAFKLIISAGIAEVEEVAPAPVVDSPPQEGTVHTPLHE